MQPLKSPPTLTTASGSYGNASQPLHRNLVEQIVRQLVLQQGSDSLSRATQTPEIIVSISARHVHLTDAHVEALFGAGHTLTPLKPLYQDGFFAAEQTVMVVGPRRRMLPAVRVLGRASRRQNQRDRSYECQEKRRDWHFGNSASSQAVLTAVKRLL